uniref:Glucosyltransferase 9 n=1 Tax=Nemophila menziesii TaxID=79376 RepID=A0A387II14_NEMME|nr:glucosyltransferase 9 [Nemophila menziesii]
MGLEGSRKSWSVNTNLLKYSLALLFTLTKFSKKKNKKKMKKPELIFIPAPGMGHLVFTVEFANRLLDRDGRLSITVIVIRTSFTPEVLAYAESLAASDARIRYIVLPLLEPPSIKLMKSPENYFSLLIERYKPLVKEVIIEHVLSRSRSIAGLVVDFFCTSMIDVANELNVPSYLFFPSNAAFLGFMLYLSIHKKKVGKCFDISDPDSIIPAYENPVPSSVLPAALNMEGYACFSNHGSRFKETKGIIINTFAELEPYAIKSLVADEETPPVYTVGPLLDLKSGNKTSRFDHEKIMNWLDDQPVSSVVFLCFGSMGGFEPPQLMQIAIALEQSGCRFLWSIRRAKKFIAGDSKGQDGPGEIFPEGFLERTQNRGMICDWAPQIDILAHEAIGSFVSHCGWNSILESLWYGVPIVTWPLYAEQQINAFEMVKELGLGVELKLDYRISNPVIVEANEIEKAIRSVMDKENPVRKRVQEIKKESRKAGTDGGSSFASIGRFIDKVMQKKAKNDHRQANVKGTMQISVYTIL